ncbi:MAG: hypothetical protein ABIR71_00340 [Chthoniobacterales bacterium]
MKILLASLMCLVLTAAQSFALSGGPPYPGTTANVVGTYAGVIRPLATTDPCGANSIAVFSIGVPQTGVSSGTFVTFAQGRVFTGTLRGTADPGRATLAAILNATFNFGVITIDPSTGTPTTVMVTASANGILDARITTASRSFGPAATRLTGEARLDISHGQLNPDLTPRVTCEINLSVIGFKQSNTAPINTT